MSKAERAELRTATIRQRVRDIIAGAVGGDCIDDDQYRLFECMGVAEFSRLVGAIELTFAPMGRDEGGNAKTLWASCWGDWGTISDIVEWLDGRSEVAV